MRKQLFSIECQKYACFALPCLGFFLTVLCDWLKEKRAPLSQPIRIKTKTNCNLLAHIFLCLSPVFYVFTSSCDWFIWLFATVVIGYSNCFGFGFTSLS